MEVGGVCKYKITFTFYLYNVCNGKMMIYSGFVSPGVENDVKRLLTGGGGWDLLTTKSLSLSILTTRTMRRGNDDVLIWCVQLG